MNHIPAHLEAKATILVPMKRDVSRGGISSNVGLTPLTAAQREHQEAVELNVDTMEQVLKDAGDGTNSFLGIGAGGPGIASRRQLTMTLEDVLKQRDRGEQIVGVYYDDEGDRWILPDPYKAAWIAGYICQHCISWQQIPHHHVCNTVHGGSCGIGNPFAAELNGSDVRHNLNV